MSVSEFSTGKHSFSVQDIQLYGEIEVQNSWIGQDICFTIHSPFLRTASCSKANIIEKIEAGAWLSVPVQTILGEGTVTLRWQREDIFIPLGARVGEYDFSTQVVSSPLETENQEMLLHEFRQNQKDWDIGEFVLLHDDEIRGAIEFQATENAKIFLFDQLWLTPEVQTSIEMLEGSEFVFRFLAEPNFDEEQLAVIRVHPFFSQAVAPMGDTPSAAERKYRLRAGIPEYSALEKIKNEVITKSNQAELAWIHQEAQALMRPLSEEEACQMWNKTKEIEMIWVGYDIDTKWDGQGCVLSIETELEQHRRRFSGEIKRE